MAFTLRLSRSAVHIGKAIVLLTTGGNASKSLSRSIALGYFFIAAWAAARAYSDSYPYLCLDLYAAVNVRDSLSHTLLHMCINSSSWALTIVLPVAQYLCNDQAAVPANNLCLGN